MSSTYLTNVKQLKSLLSNHIHGAEQDIPISPQPKPAQDQESDDTMSEIPQAKEPKVAPKAMAKKTRVKSAQLGPTRVTKSRKSKTVAKAKISARPVKNKSSGKATKGGARKVTRNVAGKVAGKGPGPRKTLNTELGGYGPEYEAEAIVDSKIVKGKRYYLVKWVGWPKSSNTWEPEANLHNAGALVTAFDVKHPDKP